MTSPMFSWVAAEFVSEPVPVNMIEAAFNVLEFVSEPFSRVILEAALLNIPALTRMHFRSGRDCLPMS